MSVCLLLFAAYNMVCAIITAVQGVSHQLSDGVTYSRKIDKEIR